MSRLKAQFWVAAYVRTVNLSGGYALVEHKGADEGGAVYILLDFLNGTGQLLKPVPQALETNDGVRRFMAHNQTAQPLAELEAIMRKEKNFDTDLWLVVVETREQKSFLQEAELIKNQH